MYTILISISNENDKYCTKQRIQIAVLNHVFLLNITVSSENLTLTFKFIHV